MKFKNLLLFLACCLPPGGLTPSADGAVVFAGDGTTITLTSDSPISIVATGPTFNPPYLIFREAFATDQAFSSGLAGSSTFTYTVTPSGGGDALGPFPIDYFMLGHADGGFIPTDFGLTGSDFDAGGILAGDTVTLSAGTLSFASSAIPQNPTSVFLYDLGVLARASDDLALSALSAVPEPANVLFTGLLLGSASLLRFRTRAR